MAYSYHNRGYSHGRADYEGGDKGGQRDARFDNPLYDSREVKKGPEKYAEQRGYYDKRQADVKQPRYEKGRNDARERNERRRNEYDDRRNRTAHEKDYKGRDPRSGNSDSRKEYKGRSEDTHNDRSGQHDRDRKERNGPYNTRHDRSPDYGGYNSRDYNRDRSRDREEDRYRDKSRDREEDRYRDKSRDREEDRYRDKSRDREEDRHRNKSRDIEEGRYRDKSRDREEDRHRDKSRDRSRDRLDDRQGDSRHRGGDRQAPYGDRKNGHKASNRDHWEQTPNRQDYNLNSRNVGPKYAGYNASKLPGDRRTHDDDYDRKSPSKAAVMSYDKEGSREDDFDDESLAPDYEEPVDTRDPKHRDSGYSEYSENSGDKHQGEALWDKKDREDSQLYSVPLSVKGEETSVCNKRRLIVTFSVVGGILAIIGLGVGLFFALRDTAISDPITVQGTMKLKDQTFIEEYEDLKSDASVELISSFCEAVRTSVTHDSSPIGPLYEDCQVTNLEEGSVIVTFRIIYTQDDSGIDLAVKTENAIQLEIDEEKDGAFGDFGAVIIIIIFIEDPVSSTTKQPVSITTTPVLVTTLIKHSESLIETTENGIVSSFPTITQSPEHSEGTSAYNYNTIKVTYPETETHFMSSASTATATPESSEKTSGTSSMSNEQTRMPDITSPITAMATPNLSEKTSESSLSTSSTSLDNTAPFSVSTNVVTPVTEVGLTSVISTTGVTTDDEKPTTGMHGTSMGAGTTRVGTTYGGTTKVTDAPTTIPDYEDCTNVTCFNNATCNDDDGPYICECQIGFTGVFCETAFRGCESNPCQNGGTCVELEPAGYYCICALCNCANNWAGTNCENDVSKCPFESTNLTSFAIPDPDDCTWYISCINNKQYGSRSCNPGLVFSFEIEDADDPCDFDNDCGEEIVLPTTPPPILTCDNVTCENGATCSDQEDMWFLCECTASFTGVFCETEIIPCDEIPVPGCQNNGECRDTPEGFVCDCPGLFDGRFCEKAFDPCSPNPCGLGTCVPSVDRLTAQCFCAACDCANGGAGQYCEFDMAMCDWRTGFFPDQNDCTKYIRCFGGVMAENGTCPVGQVASLDPGLRCVNPGNPEHTNCSDTPVIIPTPPPIHNCSEVSCLNDATCEDTVAGFICHCTINHTGMLCESEFFTCDDIECENGAECIDTDLGFFCNCTDGFRGDLCHLVRKPCDDQPCNNGGTCVNNGTEFYCICATCPCADPFITSKTCDPDLVNCEGFDQWIVLPHPMNCSKGITCTQGSDPVINECPEDLVFVIPQQLCMTAEESPQECHRLET